MAWAMVMPIVLMRRGREVRQCRRLCAKVAGRIKWLQTIWEESDLSVTELHARQSSITSPVLRYQDTCNALKWIHDLECDVPPGRCVGFYAKLTKISSLKIFSHSMPEGGAAILHPVDMEEMKSNKHQTFTARASMPSYSRANHMMSAITGQSPEPPLLCANFSQAQKTGCSPFTRFLPGAA